MQVNNEGLVLIKRWKASTEQLMRLRNQINRAECEAKNAEQALAEFLLPSDAKASEIFCVWYVDSLIAAKHNNGIKSVELRTKGKSWDELGT